MLPGVGGDSSAAADICNATCSSKSWLLPTHSCFILLFKYFYKNSSTFGRFLSLFLSLSPTDGFDADAAAPPMLMRFVCAIQSSIEQRALDWVLITIEGNSILWFQYFTCCIASGTTFYRLVDDQPAGSDGDGQCEITVKRRRIDCCKLRIDYTYINNNRKLSEICVIVRIGKIYRFQEAAVAAASGPQMFKLITLT